jgi:hypothetical protein
MVEAAAYLRYPGALVTVQMRVVVENLRKNA